MEPLLFLAHRIPFPPNKGDKIRSWHVLEHLAQRYRVHLGAFVDDPQDWQYQKHLHGVCEQVMLRPLPRWGATLRSLRGFFTHEPLTLPYYRDARMQAWVQRCREEVGIRQVFVYSSAMAGYVLGPVFSGVRRVVDFVDVDSDKWRQYAEHKPWPVSWIYRREAERLADFERAVAQVADCSLFVSTEEAELFRRQAPEGVRIGHFDNGVDWRYFSPKPGFENPYPPGRTVLVFTGAMDYWANVDAVTWFAGEILPRIRAHIPDVLFAVVGARPAKAVQRLERGGEVWVTGAVDDVRPYLHHAALSVAPLRVARGVQNKVLEAMAMGKPVVATPEALEGLALDPGLAVWAAEDAEAFAATVCERLETGPRQVEDNRRWVRSHHDWAHTLAVIDEVLE